MITPLFLAVALWGDWHGTSLCTNLKLLPACHDEEVLYHISPRGKKVHLVADKIVNGKPESMGEFDFTRDGDRLTCEMTNRQGTRALWDFTASGDRINGTLTMLPGGEVVRKIAVQRVKR